MALRRILSFPSSAGKLLQPHRAPPSSTASAAAAVAARGFGTIGGSQSFAVPPSTKNAVGPSENPFRRHDLRRHRRTTTAPANNPTSMQTIRWHGGGPGPGTPTVRITFRSEDGAANNNVTVDARIGENLLRVGQRFGVDVEGACEGVCACSTCHVVLSEEQYGDLEDRGQEPSEDEEDMLDMAYGLTESSRLSCQIDVEDWMDGMEVQLPRITRNFYVDGHKPVPH